jgi:putative two-component system response regulator
MSSLLDFTDARIAICDDSMTNVVALSKLIRRAGISEVLGFTDPRRFLEHVGNQSKGFDLLLLDLDMPHLSGFEVMRHLRADEEDKAAFPILVVTGNHDQATRHQALLDGGNDFVTKPFDPVEVGLRINNLLRVQRSYRLQKNLAERMEKEVERRTQELNRAVDTLVNRLAMAGEMRDNETGLHVTRVGRYSRLLAEALLLPPEICFMIEKAAPLHDVGKIGIPDSILHKQGVLTDTERLIMNTHAAKGAALLGNHDSMLIRMAANIALSHHEKWDGSGYPSGLKGESIPIEGRIVAVSDVFDALTSVRPYKAPWPADQAIEFIRWESGSHFDPKVIKAFMKQTRAFVETMEAMRD